MEIKNLKNLKYLNNITIISNAKLSRKELIKNGDYGLMGKIYKNDDNTCTKIFNNPNNYKNRLEHYTKLTYINEPLFITPKKFVLSSKLDFIGYSMQFINGGQINEFDNMNIYDYIDKFQKLVDVITGPLSEKRYLLGDINTGNIMYDTDKDRIVIIDTDEMEKDNEHDIEEIKRVNFNRINETFKQTLLFSQHNINIDLKIDDSFSQTYKDLVDELSNTYNVDIKTIGDIKYNNIKDYDFSNNVKKQNKN